MLVIGVALHVFVTNDLSAAQILSRLPGRQRSSSVGVAAKQETADTDVSDKSARVHSYNLIFKFVGSVALQFIFGCRRYLIAQLRRFWTETRSPCSFRSWPRRSAWWVPWPTRCPSRTSGRSTLRTPTATQIRNSAGPYSVQHHVVGKYRGRDF